MLAEGFTSSKYNVRINLDRTNSDAAVQALAVGETLTDTFNMTLTDEHGAQTPETLTITINGTNDAPVLTADSASVVEASDSTAATVTSGTLNVLTNDTDVDQGTTLKVIKANTTDVNDTDTTVTGTYGTLTIKADGTYSYSLDNTNTDVNALSNHKDGTADTLKDVFNVTVSDQNGSSDQTEALTINITGANDRPDITVDKTKTTPDSDTGTLYEYGKTLSATSTAGPAQTSLTGTLSLKDVDVKDAVTVSDDILKIEGPTSGLPANYKTLLKDMFKVDNGGGSNTVIGPDSDERHHPLDVQRR
jgi:VCBS repeat-containing protein